VSVIVPVYNVERYLEECFTSISRQSYRNIEIILINDGSTDASGRLADRLATTDHRARVIHQDNSGLSSARNRGIDESAGEFITFVDSDDYISRDLVRVLTELCIAQGSDIAQANNTRTGRLLGKGGSKVQTLTGIAAFLSLVQYKKISPTAWGKVYRRKLFTDHAVYFPVNRLHEDTAVVYKLMYFAKSISLIGVNLYLYRVNRASIMNSKYSARHYGAVELYHKELESFISSHNIPISKSAIERHKALRHLSILYKLSSTTQPQAFMKFKQKYNNSILKSRSATVVLGAIPVNLPPLFTLLRAINVTPVIRKVIGKA